MNRISPAILFLVLATACSQDPELNNKLVSAHSPLTQQVFYTDDSLLHGISLGMSKQDVIKALAPGDSVTEEEKEYLLVEGSLDQTKYYSWECQFDAAGLSSITLDVYITDEEHATNELTDITAYFSDKYGPPTDDGMALTWEVKTGRRPARIELMEDTEYPYGKLSVYYYDLSFIPAPTIDSLSADSLFLPSDVLQ